MFTVASGSHEVNYDQKCLNWFAGEMNWLWELRLFLSWTLPCPCDKRLADMDSRWRFDWRLYYTTNNEKRCYYEHIPWWFASQVSVFIILYIVYCTTSYQHDNRNPCSYNTYLRRCFHARKHCIRKHTKTKAYIVVVCPLTHGQTDRRRERV